ncbi:FAD-dependent oxidoreductase [Arthrobacter sp. zg-Y1219]|uniref:FAD-dependent oxidoreductase n=1 Tax=Arthrobacter sp. zg-Y1219 TaxID=3049067 RepID=UPI0024C45454|nr:FAD-dependent oxidoreductase [Arthrobacter sp. zg-Y1219]MDK1360595.1 FAD-dependent oxidoreductase [Arthrobacter sp. zg-Y1219]
MESLWLASAPSISADAFVPGGSYDTVVAGAGLTGLTTALLLARRGQKVAVLEARQAGAVTSGNTTAKLSLLQGLQLSRIASHQGPDGVRDYVEANRAGQDWLLEFCREHDVDHDIRTAYTYALGDGGRRSLDKELSAATAAGLAVRMTRDTELPFAVSGALELAGQAQIHPLQALASLAAEFRAQGGTLVQGVRVTGAGTASGNRVRVITSSGSVSAQHLVLATGIPVLDRGGYFARLLPLRSYAMAHPVTGDVPQGMYLSIDSPSRSLRTARVEGTDYLISGGNGHAVGRHPHPQALVDDLAGWTRNHFAVSSPAYSWSAQDYEPAAGLPYVGQVPFGDGSIFAATGFNKWGMTNAVAAALVLAEAMAPAAEDSRTGNWYSPKLSSRDVLSAARDNAEVGLEMVAGWASSMAGTDQAAPPEGQGKVVRRKAKPVGVCTVNGEVSRVSAVCPHLAGVLSWNDAEASWDCPLHGSRFAADGKLLEGPAVRGLDPA